MTTEMSIEQLWTTEEQKWGLWTPQGAGVLGDLYAEDFVEVDVSGRGVVSKAQMLDELRAGALIILEYEVLERRILQPSTDVAILIYRVRGRYAAMGAEGEADAYASSTWVKRDGRWLTVFYQATPAAPIA